MIELIRGKLAAPTLAVLRLVCRAARDDFVDGRCTALRPLLPCCDSAPPSTAAPRLRRLESLSLPGCRSQQDCADLAEFLLRLPSGGAALRELRLGGVSCQRTTPPRAGPASADVQTCPLLAAAIARLPGLQTLQFSIGAGDDPDAARLLLGALLAGVRAAPTARLVLGADGHDLLFRDGSSIATLPLAHLQGLNIRDAGRQFLMRLAAPPPAAAALAALRSLELCDDEFSPDEVDAPSDDADAAAPLPPPPPAPELWRAPWVAQLTRLRVGGEARVFRWLAASLAPRSLAAVQEFVIEGAIGFGLPEDVLAPLVAAANPATLRTLHVPGRSYSLAARLAEALPALRALHFVGCPDVVSHPPYHGDAGRRLEAEYGALRAARLAPLTSLTLETGGWACAQPARLAALLSAPWAASLRKLTLKELSTCADGRPPPLDAFLAPLKQLHTLRMSLGCFSRYEFCQALAAGWADAWAPRLVAFEFQGIRANVEVVRALLRAPFTRLERLSVELADPTGPSIPRKQLALLLDECVRALPALKSVNFSVGFGGLLVEEEQGMD